MKLTIDQARRLGAGPAVTDTIERIEVLGGRAIDHSGHAKTTQLWIYDFPTLRNVQIGIPLNKEKLSLYVRGGVSPGDTFEVSVRATGAKITEEKKSAGRHTALKRHRGLSPDHGRVILVDAGEADVHALLRTCLARAGMVFQEAARVERDQDALIMGASNGDLASGGSGAAITPEMLRQRLDRNDATGRAGERIAYVAELMRLEEAGCPDASACVVSTAEFDVGAGYDLRSEWAGEVRCIEVKTTTGHDSDFYLTANEYNVLRALGAQAWIYRVRLSDVQNGEVVARCQNPVAAIPLASMEPVAWRIPEGALGFGGQQVTAASDQVEKSVLSLLS